MLAPDIEEKSAYCKKCGKNTKHTRLKGKLNWFMLIVHIVLGIVTMGAWIVVLIVLEIKARKWKCTVCCGDD